jgi:hypothetical protein
LLRDATFAQHYVRYTHTLTKTSSKYGLLYANAIKTGTNKIFRLIKDEPRLSVLLNYKSRFH